jgi:AcrR family transcriptional regulator
MSSGVPVKEEIIQKQVVRAAQQLFQKQGLLNVTMEDLAEAIGKAKSSLYYYYKSKEEIWDAVMDIEIGEIITETAEAVTQARSIEKKIQAYCGNIIKGLRKKRALYHIAYGGNDAAKKRKSVSGIRRRFVKQESLLLNEILNEGIEKGELKSLRPKDQEVLVFVLLSGLMGLEKEMVLEKGFDLDSAINSLSHTILHGLKK